MSQDELYEQAAATYRAALDRLARGYEADPDKRKDLLQDIHLELWRSFAAFDQRCSLRTWVYRVAQNASASYVLRQRRLSLRNFVSLDELDLAESEHPPQADNRLILDQLLDLIHRLKPLDRQLMLLYLEDMDSASIGEITGITPGHVRTQIHRIKAILARRFHGGARHGE